MARSAKKSADKSQEWYEVCDGIQIKGTPERFALNWYGAVIYGCRIVKGKNGSFIGWPSFKGRNGDYVRTAYVYDGEGCNPDDRDALKLIVKVLEDY